VARIYKVLQKLAELQSLSDLRSEEESTVPPAMQVAVFEIPGGDRGTRETLERMKKIVWNSIRDKKHGAFLRGLAIKITNGCATKDYKCEARSLFEWVRDKIRWVKDTRNHETLQYPYRTIEFGAGDCDDLCLASSSVAWVKINGQIRRMTIKELSKYFVARSIKKAVMAGTHSVDRVDVEEFMEPADGAIIEVPSTDSQNRKLAKMIWRRVTRMYHKEGPVDLLRIKISGGRQITCTPNHRLYQDNNSRSLMEVRAGDLNVGDHIIGVNEVPPSDGRRFSISDEDLFMFGFWIAHGCYEHNHGPKFACGKGVDLAKRVMAWAATRQNNWKHPIGSSLSKKGDVAVCSRSLMSWMKELGLGGTSATKRVPEWIFELPEDQIIPFLAGYFQDDGNIRLNKLNHRTVVSVRSVNRELLTDMLDLLNRIGINGSIGVLNSNGTPCAAHRITISARQAVERFVEKIGNFRNSGVMFSGEARSVYPLSFRTIRSIDVVREYEIFDLEVASDSVIEVPGCDNGHRHVIDGILTHNSTLLGTLATAIGMPVKMRAIAASPSNKHQFSHVYLMMNPNADGKTWIAADPTVKSAAFGWESPVRYRIMDMDI